MDKLKKHKSYRLLLICSPFLIGGIVALLIYLFVNQKTPNQMANEDFLAVQNFKKPIYARPVDYAADGGTIVYKGQGYFIEVRKSIETQNLDQPNEVQGYIYGPRIIYGAKNEKGINYEKQDLKFYPAQVLRDLLDKNRADKN